jgi:hypothetical protein
VSRFRLPRRAVDDEPVVGLTRSQSDALGRHGAGPHSCRPRRAAAPPAPVPPKSVPATAEAAAAYWTAVSARLDEIAAANEKRREGL